MRILIPCCCGNWRKEPPRLFQLSGRPPSCVPNPATELSEAQNALLTASFHDILPGSSIQPVEEMAVRLMDSHALHTNLIAGVLGEYDCQVTPSLVVNAKKIVFTDSFLVYVKLYQFQRHRQGHQTGLDSLQSSIASVSLF